MSATFVQRGGMWVIIQFALMLAVMAAGVRWHGSGWGKPALAAGVVLLLCSGAAGLAGVAVLGRNRTPFPQPRGDSELIQHGIYARVRHPLYTSVLLLSVAWALLWQSWPALAVAVVQFPFFQAKARREERWLIARFPGYADYARRVPRFFPRIGPASKFLCNF